jgi:hypothetical protein
MAAGANRRRPSPEFGPPACLKSGQSPQIQVSMLDFAFCTGGISRARRRSRVSDPPLTEGK